jgi:flagellar export protein FliJ
VTRTQRLKPVVQHTDRKEQMALREVAQAQGLLELEKSRLAQLRDYKLEYLQKQKHDIGVVTPLQLQEFNRFMQQLDQTALRQMEVMELRQQELAHKQKLWNGTRVDSKKMHKVVDKLQQQEFVEQERKEQKALDEFGMRKK